ncbi:hypothetical protein N7465_009151 [Penicillium sp. CMV-2018d]|nr:hypothetical protein N7465_009151 [Penicillium sp. CMV-2018d]
MVSQGVRIQLVTCDIGNREHILRIQEANSERAVGGVLNYAVSYQDISFDKMTAENVSRCQQLPRLLRTLPAAIWFIGNYSVTRVHQRPGSLTQDEVTLNLFARTKGQTVTVNQVLRALGPAFVKNSNTKDQWLGRSEDPLSAANIFTGIDPAVLANMKRAESKRPALGTVPRWYHDPRVSLMLRAMDDGWRYGNGEGNDKSTFGFDDVDESPAVCP